MSLRAKLRLHCPGLQLASPRDPAQRGSHVWSGFPEGYAVIRALIAQGSGTNTRSGSWSPG
ncbi:kynureninase/PvdN C-terminal domain-containing protein [Ruegeria spongiae]|uniref:kynureninase/PvdN C-terminal domain-containing protein n=1 Tax=Ruegeria spongiae TaxID=2942209 RepID=UPI0035712A95